MLKTNDFFCGAGGMGLGFKHAGFKLSGAWDFDKYAVKTYYLNLSTNIRQADIRQLSWDQIPCAHVWTFGFPCQDISIAGKQAGMIRNKTRSGLFYEIMRLLDETSANHPDQLPPIILAENVKNVDKLLPEIKREYAIRDYVMYTTLYNSKYWQVPQNRERYFILGVHKNINKPFHFAPEQKSFIPKLSSVLEDQVDEKYYIPTNIILQADKQLVINEKSPHIPIENHGNIHVVGRLNIRGQDNVRRVYNPEGIAPTLTTSEGGNRQPKVILSSLNQGGLVDFKIRKLTPREYARLQGFPDWFKQEVSNAQFYKQMGNAITVNVSYAIAKQIANFLKG